MMSTKRKVTTKIAPPVVRQSAKAPTKSWVNEAQATVTAAAPVSSIPTIDISSDSSSNYGEDSDSEEVSDDEHAAAGLKRNMQNAGEKAADAKARISADQDPDTDMLYPPHTDLDEDTSAAELAAPSFGDLIRNHEVDVANALAPQQEPTPDSQLQPRIQTLAPPSLSSLGTVLTQALRTDDNDLLESCLHTTELKVVQNTIQRMDSSLAGILLTKLAARMHRRPGRAHSLMSWVQWTLIAHGGALASDANVVKRLGELNRVLEERARGLPSLLALKGKLDMLDGQMQIRRDNRLLSGAGRSLGGLDDGEEDEHEQGIIYVEGEEEVQVNGVKDGRRGGEEDDYLITNGVADSDDDEEDDDNDMAMDEVEVLDEESLDEDEVDHDDIEESGEEDDSEVEPAAPPSKLQKTSKAFSKRK